MSWERLCNKNVLAVIGYFVLQILLLVGFSLTCSAIVDTDNDLVYLIFFWISVFVTLVLYIWLHFKDPGFIPHNNHSFREHEENNFSRPKNSQRNESEMKFRALDSRNQSVHEHLPYELKIEIKEKMTNINRVHMRRLKFSDAMTNSTTNLNTNTNMYTGKLSTQEKGTPVAGTVRTIKTQEVYDKEDKDEEFHKIETQIPSKDAVRGSQNVVVCEPSIDEKDEGEESSGEEYNGPVDFNAKSKDALEVSEEGIEMKSFSPQATKDTFLFPLYRVSRESNHQVNLKTVQSNTDDHDVEGVQRRIKTEMEPAMKKKVYSYARRSMSNHDFAADASCNVPLQTGDEDKTKEYKLEEIHMRLERYPARNMADGLAPRNIKPAFISKPLVKIESPLESPLGRKDLDISNLRPPSEGGCSDRADAQSNHMNNDSKEGPKEGNQQEQQGQNQKIELHEEEIDAQGKKKDSIDIFYVEKRYCTVCNLEQPFRSKHCKDCNRCIGKYDHHCPWLGNCVGEKNHCLFYWFLVFQTTEIVLGQIKMYICTLNDDEYKGSLAIKIIILVVSTIFLAMTGSLLIFHTILALKNLTTWEALSWNKITYLNDWPKSWGSPFSRGILRNLKYFCWKRKKELTQWEMPKYRKPLSQQPKEPKDNL